MTERDPARVVAVGDGVIAIAVTLLVLEIKPPEHSAHLLHGLLKLWPSYPTSARPLERRAVSPGGFEPPASA
jgi:uncharacterized membrane protein